MEGGKKMARCSFFRNRSLQWDRGLDIVCEELLSEGLPTIDDRSRWYLVETKDQEVLTFEGTVEEVEQVRAVFRRTAFGLK